MKIAIISILFFIVLVVNAGATNADDLLDEINSLIQFISIQSNRGMVVKQSGSSNIRTIIRKAAERYRLDPLLIEAIITVESNFNRYAVSQKGAMGLMQLMPETAREIGVTRPFDPYQNIIGGTYYYRLMLVRYGEHRKALYAYNCGAKCVDNGRIPKESREYARNVIRVYKDLKKKGGRHVR